VAIDGDGLEALDELDDVGLVIDDEQLWLVVQKQRGLTLNQMYHTVSFT